MYRRTRRAVITSLLVSSVACGGAVVLAPSAGAAVPAASCTVTPSADGTSVTISGEGFTAPRTLNDGESTVPLSVDATGHFLLKRFQKNVSYTVLAVNEDQNFTFVNCRVVKAPNPQSPQPTPKATPQNSRDDRAQGRQAGGEAGRAAAASSCNTRPKPDKGQQHSAAYWQAWTQAANRAFNQVCGR
ncbi:hypothetical protein AMK16_21815 [Streptomyces sp. CB00455]|uniref:hypothetical protein n=1 Tax=Streptomyces sp. CB00455 TaxID=1703927 RepID=UPI00093A4112|nr:hypothetical protein [Streptomyces sp. CB00455]OKK17465.1 hypothetical protein AMK16_21815 [Streptomyces sp. CB00455]